MIPMQFALRRRMMMAGGLLPNGYTRVDYIQGIGSQYIDTGFVVNKSDNYALEIDALFPSQAQAYQGCNGYMQFITSSKYGISGDSSVAVGNRNTVRVEYANQTEKLFVDGAQIESKSWSAYNGANVKLGILRLGDVNNGWFNGTIAQGTIYGYKVWKNNILVSECIPCVRNSDNVAGVYDVIREQFITNAGSGAFKFPAVLPSGLKYSGDAGYTVSDNKYIVKLLSSGTLTVNKTLNVSVYLLAGGGGGAGMRAFQYIAGGGGGGNNSFDVALNAGEYEIVVGKGGTGSARIGGDSIDAVAGAGGDTSAFGNTVTGGTGAKAYAGYSKADAGIGGQPNGSNGKVVKSSEWRPARAEGGSPNGGAAEWTGGYYPVAHNGGDGYVTITIPI